MAKGFSEAKIPVLDRLMVTNAPQLSRPNTQVVKQQISIQPRMTDASIPTPPAKQPAGNRHTDKSQFEMQLSAIIARVLTKHINLAKQEIVKEVLQEARSRLPGQKNS